MSGFAGVVLSWGRSAMICTGGFEVKRERFTQFFKIFRANSRTLFNILDLCLVSAGSTHESLTDGYALVLDEPVMISLQQEEETFCFQKDCFERSTSNRIY